MKLNIERLSLVFIIVFGCTSQAQNQPEKDTRLLIFDSIKGYISHSLQKCLEQENKYALLVQWEDLEAHTVGFRTSAAYLKWKELLHHYYDPFPTVEHYIKISK